MSVAKHRFDDAAREAVYRAINARRDVRHFIDAPLEAGLLQRLLAAAHAAPSVGLSQPWAFIHITDAALRLQIHTLVEAERRRTAAALGEKDWLWSGLREGEQYFMQQSHADDAGSRLRTDVEIVMPNGDKIIIDSKVSLVAFEAFTNSQDEDERADHLARHITSMRGHIKTLSSKEYHRHAQSGLDFVFMFVPIESAFSVAVTREPGLIDHALSQGVLITTPTTLMSALRTVRNVWDIEKRHQNAELIADRAGLLYDKLAGFMANMDKIDKSLSSARQSYDAAKGQLSSGPGNAVRQVEMLRELGAKSSKELPTGWQDDEAGAVIRLAAETPDSTDDDRKAGEN